MTVRIGTRRRVLLPFLALWAAGAAVAGPLGPEAVHDMQVDPQHQARVEVISIDPQATGHRPVPAAERFPRDVSVVYACWSLSQRRCRDEVLRAEGAGRERTFWLTGTPREWLAAKVAFNELPPAMVEARLHALETIDVRDLADARKDGTTFTLIDLRRGLGANDARIDGAIDAPAGLLSEKRELLPKNGWIVLYDGGDRSAEAVARELRGAGFPMAVALAGGYPAWVTSDQR